MAKLKCTFDNRRVMVLDNGRVLHRSDGSGCKTPTVTIGSNTFTRKEFAAATKTGRFIKHVTNKELKAEKLLLAIFGDQAERAGEQ